MKLTAFNSGKYAAIDVGKVTNTKALTVAAKKTIHDGNRSALRNQIEKQ